MTLSTFTWKSEKGWNSSILIVKLSINGAFVSACINPVFIPNFPLKFEVLRPTGRALICAFVGPNTWTSVNEESPARLNPKNIRNSIWHTASSPELALVAIRVGILNVNLSLSTSGWLVTPIVAADIVVADAVAFPEAVV